MLISVPTSLSLPSCCFAVSECCGSGYQAIIDLWHLCKEWKDYAWVCASQEEAGWVPPSLAVWLAFFWTSSWFKKECWTVRKHGYLRMAWASKKSWAFFTQENHRTFCYSLKRWSGLAHLGGVHVNISGPLVWILRGSADKQTPCSNGPLRWDLCRELLPKWSKDGNGKNLGWAFSPHCVSQEIKPSLILSVCFSAQWEQPHTW